MDGETPPKPKAADADAPPGPGPGAGGKSEQPSGRPRRRRLLALGAGAVGLTAIAALASVQLLGGGDTAPKGEAPQTTSAGSRPWTAAPAPEQGTPQCTYGAGKVLCAQTGLVFALDPTDGRLLWRHPVAPPTPSTPSAPTVAPLMAGGLMYPSPAPGSRQLAPLDPATGKASWRQNTPVYSGVTAAGGMLLLTGADGTVTGVDGASGATKWSHSIPGHKAPYLVSFAQDPLAYTTLTSDDGSYTRVTAVDPATGDVRWDARLKGTLTLADTADGSVFLLPTDGIYNATRAVIRYSPADRTTQRVSLPRPVQQAHGAVRGNVFYLVADGGSLFAVDMKARRQLWSLETSVTRTSSPVADGRHVYVSTPDGRLLAVDARDGRLVGQTPTRLGTDSDRVAADLPEPLLADGHVYAAAPDGTVFAVDARDPSAW